MNLPEIIALSQIIHKCQNLEILRHVYSQKSNYDHPQVSYDFGVAFLLMGDKITAKNALLRGASFGIKYPCPIYNNPLVDSIGQCMAILMQEFSIANNAYAVKVTALGYIYLSRCIEMYKREAHDSYRTRAMLFRNHQNPMVIQGLLMDNVGLGKLADPYVISDFYFASQATGSPHKNALRSAQQIHQSLDDISIGGKDADEYTLNEMADFGEKRHMVFFQALQNRFSKGDFDLTLTELNSSIR